MKFQFKKMSLQAAEEIASWQYSGFMESIYMKPYFDQYNEITGEMKGPGNCDGYAVYVEDELYGLFEFYDKEGILEIGLALKPDFTGQGLSKEFILAGIEFGVEEYHYDKSFLQLTVEQDNIAAFNAYKKVGFTEVSRSGTEIVMHYQIKKP